MIRSGIALVRLFFVLALCYVVIQVVETKQNHQPVRSPRIVHQIGSRIP